MGHMLQDAASFEGGCAAKRRLISALQSNGALSSYFFGVTVNLISGVHGPGRPVRRSLVQDLATVMP